MFNQQLFKRTFKALTREYYASLRLYGLSLNSFERVKDSAADLKTLDNNPDAYLTSLREFLGLKPLKKLPTFK